MLAAFFNACGKNKLCSENVVTFGEKRVKVSLMDSLQAKSHDNMRELTRNVIDERLTAVAAPRTRGDV